MSTFQPIIGAWFDPFELICSLRPRMGWFKDKSTIAVTDKVLARWPELGNMLNQIREFAADRFVEENVIVALIGRDAAAPTLAGRFVMALRTHPRFAFHGPLEVCNPPPGQLYLVNQNDPVWSVNQSDIPWIGVVIEATVKAQ